ncbi:MAG: hypothetical protein AAGG72_07085 [Pseudomonadota bacterium]
MHSYERIKPAFDTYTLAELRHALVSLDRRKYPERVVEIERMMTIRQQEWDGGGFVASGEAHPRLPNRWNARIRRFSFPTVFKLVFCGIWLAFIPLLIGVGILAMLGAEMVKLNGQFVHDARALMVVGLLASTLAPVIALVMSILAYIGHRVLALWWPLSVQAVVDRDVASDT